jgi:D-xylulose reductase
MQALVLEKTHHLAVRDVPLDEPVGPHDVRVRIHTVGICGSDVHYYQHGRIGPFVVNAPMVLGHEASGTVVENRGGRHDPEGRRPRLHGAGHPRPERPGHPASGLYNLDPAVRFWATPPVHGCLRPTVVHPAAFTFRVPDNVSYAEAAMVEPLAVGMHAANKAQVKPGDVAVVMGAGPIGMVTALAALAGGASRVVMTDVQQPKLDLAATLGPITPVNVAKQSLRRRSTG